MYAACADCTDDDDDDDAATTTATATAATRATKQSHRGVHRLLCDRIGTGNYDGIVFGFMRVKRDATAVKVSLSRN